MSSEPVLLYIVTDNADRACLGLFGFARKRAPGWVGFVEDATDFRRIPDGAAVMSVWFSDRPLIETLWREERAVRSFDIDYGKHAARIQDWLNRRAAAERALVAQWLDVDAPSAPAAEPEAALAVSAPPVAPPVTSVSSPVKSPMVMWS